jgi:hypothetical protein
MVKQEGVPNAQIEYFVSAGSCREFMASLGARPEMWKELLEFGWGGHLHQAILECAISDSADDDLVDIIPGYVNAVIRHPEKRLIIDETTTEEDKLRKAYAVAAMNLKYVEPDERDKDPLGAFESSLSYTNQASVPWHLLKAQPPTES